MKIGCHCVMFAGKLATDTEEVIDQISTTGFQGVECGARFLSLDNREKLLNALKKNNLELAAIHFAGKWKEEPEETLKAVVKEAEFIAKNPNPNITFSYMPEEDDDAVAMAKLFNKAALECKALGASLKYHNHAGEFANGGKFYHALVEYAPDLNFGFDLGWVRRGGFDPIAVLKETAGRCTYVHLRDPDDGPDNMEINGRKFYRFPDLGYGLTDLKGQLAFLKDYLPENGWVIVEYEGGEPDVQRYVRAKQVIDSLM